MPMPNWKTYLIKYNWLTRTTFFNLRITWATLTRPEHKLLNITKHNLLTNIEHNLVTNILKLKWPTHVTSKNSPFSRMVRIYRPRFIGKNNDHVMSQDLEIINSKFSPIRPRKKKLVDEVIFEFLPSLQNWFLVCKTHVNHVIKMITSSIIIFCQGVYLMQASTSYHAWNSVFKLVSRWKLEK